MSETPATGGRLAELAKFENMFQRDNLSIGLMVWLKSNGVMWIISLAVVLSGALALLGNIWLFAAVFINFALLRWAVSGEAHRRYGFTPLPSCWWSVFWRVFVYMLPVSIVLVLMMPAGYLEQTPEQLAANTEPMQYAQLIYLMVSIIPLGLATSKAILISWNRLVRRVNDGGPFPPADREGGNTAG